MLCKRTYENGAANKRSLHCLKLEQATKVRPGQNSFLLMSITTLFKVRPVCDVGELPAVKCVNVNIDLQKLILANVTLLEMLCKCRYPGIA